MKRMILVIFGSTLFTQSCAEQGNNKLNEIDTAAIQQSSKLVLLEKSILKYNAKTVFFALYSLRKETEKNNSTMNALKIGELYRSKPDTANFVFMSYEKKLLKTELTNQKKVLKKIDEWSSFYFLFNSLIGMDYKEPVFIEEIIFEMPETKHLFDNYIENPTQDWGSLDVAQISEIYFDFINYMVELNSEKRIQILSKFITFIQNKQKKAGIGK